VTDRLAQVVRLQQKLAGQIAAANRAIFDTQADTAITRPGSYQRQALEQVGERGTRALATTSCAISPRCRAYLSMTSPKRPSARAADSPSADRIASQSDGQHGAIVLRRRLIVDDDPVLVAHAEVAARSDEATALDSLSYGLPRGYLDLMTRIRDGVPERNNAH
jgi:hypothetical protein